MPPEWKSQIPLYRNPESGCYWSHYIFKAMDKKEITAMVLIDLSKAFNSICHRTLLLKLQGLGV